MKGSPSVLWTCDRCGDTATKPPETAPSQWWVWTAVGLDRPATQPSIPTYEVCDRCDSAIRNFISTGLPEAQS